MDDVTMQDAPTHDALGLEIPATPEPMAWTPEVWENDTLALMLDAILPGLDDTPDAQRLLREAAARLRQLPTHADPKVERVFRSLRNSVRHGFELRLWPDDAARLLAAVAIERQNARLAEERRQSCEARERARDAERAQLRRQFVGVDRATGPDHGRAVIVEHGADGTFRVEAVLDMTPAPTGTHDA